MGLADPAMLACDSSDALVIRGELVGRIEMQGDHA
jgi:hypothetical protein